MLFGRFIKDITIVIIIIITTPLHFYPLNYWGKATIIFVTLTQNSGSVIGGVVTYFECVRARVCVCFRERERGKEGER